MPLGTGYDYYIPVDHETEKYQKLMDKVWDWWDGLTDLEQYGIIMDWYSIDFGEDDNADKYFGNMPNEKQLEIYNDNN